MFQAFAQNPSPDYSVVLGTNEKFVKIEPKAIIDSLNLNQKGPEQFEYFEITLSQKEAKAIDAFMKSCRSISSIIDRYGEPSFDIVMGSNSKYIRPLSGFHYSFGYSGSAQKDNHTLTVIYPRMEQF